MRYLRSACVLGLVVAAGVAGQEATSLAGHYEGVLKTPNSDVKLMVDLDKDAKKAWIGHMTITPGPNEVPISVTVPSSDAVNWTIANIPNAPTFSGKWNAESKALTGSATLGPTSMAFELKRTGDAKVVVPAESSALGKDFEGKWLGSVTSPQGQTLRLEMTLRPDTAGKATATLISVDQGGATVPVSTVTQTGDELVLDVKLVGGGFKGKMNAGKTEIAGDWSQGGSSTPLTFKRVEPEKKAEPAKP